MPELPMENPNKYGSAFDDADDFAALLSGGKPAAARSAVPAGEDASGAGERVDENFLREVLRDSESKYGR